MSIKFVPSRSLNLKEVAEILAVHPNTVRTWANAGKIPHFRVGRQMRFSKKKIEEWMEKDGNI